MICCEMAYVMCNATSDKRKDSLNRCICVMPICGHDFM